MAQFFQVHPDNPQPRLISRAVEIVRMGGLMVYPADSSYSLACSIDSKAALDRVRAIRQLDEKHLMTLVCENLTQVATFAKLEDEAFRILKQVAPGLYTFVLKAGRDTPRRLQHPTRKTIGVRLPGNPIAQALVTELGAPFFTTTLILPGHDSAMTDPVEIRERLEHHVDVIIDAGVIPYEPTTVVSFTEGAPEVVRQGIGKPAWLN